MHAERRESSKVSATVALEQMMNGAQVSALSSSHISLASMKQLATRLLPSNSLFRMMILSQPDNMDHNEWRAKAEVLIPLLYRELGR